MSEVEIQCPECGGKLAHDSKYKKISGMFCDKCKNYYTESEVRERCGL